MKIQLLTIYDVNYGNRLQNYAAYKLLSAYADEVCNLYVADERRSVYTSQPRNNRIKRLIKKFIPTPYFRWKVQKKKTIDLLLEEKTKRFQMFTMKYMKNEWVTIRKTKELFYKAQNEEYDMYFVGSDQVWNPDFAGDDFFFLDFVNPNKRAAISASIGYESVDKRTLKKYARYWKTMRYISVREESAASIIKNEINREVDVLLDPTMLLTVDEWNEIMVKPRFNIPSTYILVVFLGTLPNDILKQYENIYGLELIILNEKSFKDYYLVDPAEFLYLVKNASLILTDSFHCTVFSIIFHKQFKVFRRDTNKLKDMFARMETLLDKMGYMDRIQDDMEGVKRDIIVKKRFLESDRIMEEEREKVKDILSRLLNGVLE